MLTTGNVAPGTLAFTVYANTTKNDGSKFTQIVKSIQVEVSPY
jgi:hypothetical protein